MRRLMRLLGLKRPSGSSSHTGPSSLLLASRYLPLLVAALFAAGVALGQVTLGKMFRLGTTTTAGRPASSTTIRGALLYDTDVNKVIVNDGTAWQELGGGGSGGDTYWTDGGTNTALGTVSTYRFPAASGVNAITMDNVGARVHLGGNASNYLTAPANGNGVASPYFESSAAGGQTAIRVNTDSARLQLGTGTYTYFEGTGTSISTPSTVVAQAFDAQAMTGPAGGVIVRQQTGNSLPTPDVPGHILSHGDWFRSGSNLLVYDGLTWSTLGLASHWAIQRKSMLVEAVYSVSTAPPPHRVRIPLVELNGSELDTQWLCSDTATASNSVRFQNGRYYRMSRAAADPGGAAYCHNGQTAGAVVGITQLRLFPRLCAWVFPSDEGTNRRLWFGLGGTEVIGAAAGSDTPTGESLVALRYSNSASDSAWKLVACAGGSCDVQNTGIPVGIAETQRICLDVGDPSKNAVWVLASFHGATYATAARFSTGGVSTSTNLGVFFLVKSLSNTNTAGFGLSNLSLETQ